MDILIKDTRLLEFSVEKYGLFKERALLDFKEVTCISGKNNTGKTSLLEAFYKLIKLMQGVDSLESLRLEQTRFTLIFKIKHRQYLYVLDIKTPKEKKEMLLVMDKSKGRTEYVKTHSYFDGEANINPSVKEYKLYNVQKETIKDMNKTFLGYLISHCPTKKKAFYFIEVKLFLSQFERKYADSMHNVHNIDYKESGLESFLYSLDILPKGIQYLHDRRPDWHELSSNTKKIILVLEDIFTYLKSGGVIIIDDIDYSIPRYLMYEIMRLFLYNENNPNGTQLVSVHNSYQEGDFGLYRQPNIHYVYNKNNETCVKRGFF